MKGTGATRGMGRAEGVVGRSSGGIELGLKVGGIGQLGISTDYGGGIVIGIFGQKIVWGREGGKIHYNFGGLEVIVEARNCVVVENRKVLGKIISSRVYPDPGCNIPGSFLSTSPMSPTPPLGQVITNYTCPNGDKIELFFNPISSTASERYTLEQSLAEQLAYFRTTTSNPNGYNSEQLKDPSGTDIFYANQRFGEGNWISATVDYYSFVYWSERKENDPYYEFLRNGKWHINGVPSGNEVVRIKFTMKRVRYFHKQYPEEMYAFYGTPYNWEAKVIDILPPPPCTNGGQPAPVEPPSPPSAPSAGNQPPMPELCCQALAADIEDIKEVLACKEILAGKMTFPWKWRMPGGQGEEIIMDYPNLLRAIAQQIDHLGIHPPKLTVKDINNAIAGDQGLSNQFPSVTQAFEALMAQVWDANADVDTLTNFLYRLAWLNVQQSFNMARLTGSVESLKDMIGGETESLETEITTPFNIAAGTGAKKIPPGKGFGKSANGASAIDNRIEANTEMSTEAMLPEFLKIRENPILVDSFTGKQDIFDILLLIRADLEKLKNK